MLTNLDRLPKQLEGNIVKKSDIIVVDRDQLPDDIGALPVHYYVDSADKTGERNDPTGIAAVVFYYGFVYIIDYAAFKVEFNERLERIDAFTHLHSDRRSIIVVEPKSSGIAIKQAISKDPYNHNSKEFEMPRGSKLDRIVNSLGPMQSGKLILLRDQWRPWTADFIKTLTTYTGIDSVGFHDEPVDITSMVIYRRRTQIQREKNNPQN